MEQSELKAEGLRKAQVLQFEAITEQSQAHNNMQMNMRISQALLDKTTTAAANLQTMIDETTTRYREFPALSGLLGSYSAWVVCALLLSLLCVQNPKTAMVVVLIGMCWCLLSLILLLTTDACPSSSHCNEGVPLTRVYGL